MLAILFVHATVGKAVNQLIKNWSDLLIPGSMETMVAIPLNVISLT
jgi:hypothetical protein